MKEVGANRLRKAVQQMHRRGGVGVLVQPIANDLLKIEKTIIGTENRSEFAFIMRVQNTSGGEYWWPIEYQGPNNEIIRCETVVNGKIMLNTVKQDGLIELAETWAKALEAQTVAQTIGNALI